MGRDEQIGRMILEATAGMHGNMARDIAQAWCSMAEQKQNLLQRIDQLEKENASLKKDAARYRWLSAQHWVEPEVVFRLGLSDTDDLGEYQSELDAAIDTAMQKD